MSKEDWIVNLEIVANTVASNLGYEAVNFVLSKYGAACIEDLQESYYPDVFGELYHMAQDD